VPAQRATIEACAASWSSGNSRKISRAWPVSMYLVFSSGSTALWNAAQWGQVIEAYSTIVLGASSLPSEISGKAPGFISSDRSRSVFSPAATLGVLSRQMKMPAAIATAATAPSA
jgi:hypothetical protein